MVCGDRQKARRETTSRDDGELRRNKDKHYISSRVQNELKYACAPAQTQIGLESKRGYLQGRKGITREGERVTKG